MVIVSNTYILFTAGYSMKLVDDESRLLIKITDDNLTRVAEQVDPYVITKHLSPGQLRELADQQEEDFNLDK